MHTVLRFYSTQIYSEMFFLNIIFFMNPKAMKFGGYIQDKIHDPTKFNFVWRFVRKVIK